MSKLYVDQVDPKTATTLTLGTSGDTISIPSGVTIANAGTATGFGGANTPYFAAQLTSNQNIGDDTITKLAFDNELIDSDGDYDKDTNYRFTPTTAGKYFISSDCVLTGDAAGAFISGYLKIYKNGSAVTNIFIGLDSSSDARQKAFSTSLIIDMDGSSDYVEVYGQVDRTGAGNAQAQGTLSSTFQGFKLI